jgi:hypothetical protein
MDNDNTPRFVEQQVMHKNFLIKTINLMYIMIFLCVSLAVFFYVISVGYKLFIIITMLIIAAIGAFIAVDARRRMSELDAFGLYYTINKLKNVNQKKV